MNHARQIGDGSGFGNLEADRIGRQLLFLQFVDDVLEEPVLAERGTGQVYRDSEPGRVRVGVAIRELGQRFVNDPAIEF